jgi:hypothetical protein
MPLSKGKTKNALSKNIKELVHSYKKTGNIGKSRPSSKKEAIKQATAIAYSTQRKSKK